MAALAMIATVPVPSSAAAAAAVTTIASPVPLGRPVSVIVAIVAGAAPRPVGEQGAVSSRRRARAGGRRARRDVCGLLVKETRDVGRRRAESARHTERARCAMVVASGALCNGRAQSRRELRSRHARHPDAIKVLAVGTQAGRHQRSATRAQIRQGVNESVSRAKTYSHEPTAMIAFEAACSCAFIECVGRPMVR